MYLALHLFINHFFLSPFFKNNLNQLILSWTFYLLFIEMTWVIILKAFHRACQLRNISLLSLVVLLKSQSVLCFSRMPSFQNFDISFNLGGPILETDFEEFMLLLFFFFLIFLTYCNPIRMSKY